MMNPIQGATPRTNPRLATLSKPNATGAVDQFEKSQPTVQLQVPSLMLQSTAFRQKVSDYADRGMRVQVEFLPEGTPPKDPQPPSKATLARLGAALGTVGGAAVGAVGSLTLGILFFKGGLGPVIQHVLDHGAFSLQTLASAAPITMVATAIAAAAGAHGGKLLGSKLGHTIAKTQPEPPPEPPKKIRKLTYVQETVSGTAALMAGPLASGVGGALTGFTLASTGHLLSSSVHLIQMATPGVLAATVAGAALAGWAGKVGAFSLEKAIHEALPLN